MTTSIYSNYAFGQLIGPLLDRKQNDLEPNLPGERDHFLASRHQVFGHHYVTPFGLPPETKAASRLPRVFFKHATGTGKTTLSLLIMSHYLEIPRVSVYVLGFENTKEVFLTDAFKFPELGYVSQAEYAHLLHLRQNYYKNPSPLTRQEMQTFTQRLRSRLTNRGRGIGGVYFFGYQEFANRCGFADLDRREDADLREREPNDDFVESLRGSLIIADEIPHAYNSREVNSRGAALEYTLNKLGDAVHFVALSATPMNNHPAESIELAKLLWAGTGEPAPQRSTYFRDYQLINESAFIKLFEGRISSVAATETHLYPTIEWPAIATEMNYIDTDGRSKPMKDFRFIQCQMPPYQLKALEDRGKVVADAPDESELELGGPGNSLSTYFLRDFAWPKDPEALYRGDFSGPACMTSSDLLSSYGRQLNWNKVLSQARLEKTSGKYAAFAPYLRTLRGKGLIFHPRVRWGVEFAEHLLEAEGFARGDDMPDENTPCALCGELAKAHRGKREEQKVVVEKGRQFGGPAAVAVEALPHAFKAARFLTMHAHIERAQITKSRNLFNTVANTNGAEYQFLVGSEMMAIGHDFKCVQHIIVFGFPDTWHMFKQLMGRAVRKLSHANLPPNQRKVTIHIFVNVDRTNSANSSPERYSIKYPVYEEINRVEVLMDRIAIDREIFMPYERARAELGLGRGNLGSSGKTTNTAVQEARYYARGLFKDELANVYRVIKRLFVDRPIWKYDDFIAAVRNPPFSVNVDVSQTSDDTIAYVLQHVIYRAYDRAYLNMVSEFAQANTETSCLFTLEAESKFFIRDRNVCVLSWKAPFLVLQPINIPSRSVVGTLVAPKQFVTYRLNLLSNEVSTLMSLEKPTWRIFHEFDAATHNAAIRQILEASGSPHNALLRLYTHYGIIRSAVEYWQNTSGFRYVASSSAWIATAVERPAFNFVLGFFEDKQFKIIRPELVINRGDARMMERGSACMNKSMIELQELAALLKLPAAVQKRGKREEICATIEDYLLAQQVDNGNKRTYVLFWGPPQIAIA